MAKTDTPVTDAVDDIVAEAQAFTTAQLREMATDGLTEHYDSVRDVLLPVCGKYHKEYDSAGLPRFVCDEPFTAEAGESAPATVVIDMESGRGQAILYVERVSTVYYQRKHMDYIASIGQEALIRQFANS